MKCLLLFPLFLLYLSGRTQQINPVPLLLTLSEDNDYINVRGQGSDEGYTHGFRADVFYNKAGKSTFFADRWINKNQRNVVTGGWGIMQTMITPSDLKNVRVADRDYRYACSFTLTRTFHVSNPEKKYSVQTEFVLGILGPAALGKQTQVGMHRAMRCDPPMGWDTQLGTAPLVNINLTFEKALVHVHPFIEYVGGVKIFTGTSMNALSTYTLLRAGKMNPYFSGLLSRYRSAQKGQWQLYATFGPSLDFIIQNAHVEGNLFRYGLENDYPGEDPNNVSGKRTLNHIGFSMEYGVVICRNNISISLAQRSVYAMINEQPRHAVGNLSLHLPLATSGHKRQ